MFCVLHCGGLAFNGDTIKTKSLGGSETAAFYLAKELAKDHKVTIFTNSQETGIFDGVRYEWAGNITEQSPLGERFTFYAEHTPHDILIIQRSLHAFERKWASKLNYWWLHDIAQIRNKEHAQMQMWNVDRVLCVSEWHKNQVAEAWGIEKTNITVANNAIDHALFIDKIESKLVDAGKKNLIYSSRPERGLINLVGEGGIMEKLHAKDPAFHLYVCGYENTVPEMADFYAYLYQRCADLPNVTNLGALTKKELADTMRQCDALVYPTSFEEVSMITAMEAMAAGLQIISSDWAALPETCTGSQSVLLDLVDETIDIEAFTNTVIAQVNGIDDDLKFAQVACAAKYTWERTANTIIADARSIFKEHASERALAFHFMRHSDIVALERCNLAAAQGALADELRMEFDKGYAFYRDDTYAAHYAAYYQYEKDRGVEYGPEDVTRTSRFQSVANMVGLLPEGSRVLDYGCAHGHYTVALAKRFPTLTFVGADLAQSNIDKAIKWAADEGLTNVQFTKVDGAETLPMDLYDLIVAAEVVEHVGNPQELIDTLAGHLMPIGQMVITTPYGPWEAQGYREHKYWRAHLHHFERQDLADMLGHHPNYKVIAAPAGKSQFHSVLGSYIVSFGKPTEVSRQIDYKRKIEETMPDQTVSLCMIVKDAEQDIQRCLASVLPYVQEVIIGVDSSTTDGTWQILQVIADKNPLVAFDISMIEPAVKIGFSEARNWTVSKASCDWIMWLDADEVLTNGCAISQYVRNSQYNGFAVKQHHFSTDPMAIIKIDLPCRLFRNGKGIQFFGRVHEHPEIKINEGLGPIMLLPHVEIAHYGYTGEAVRRKRFARNIGLLKQDREELPDRILGKFLWLRDLAQMCQYDVESGQANQAEFQHRADAGIKLWEELLASGNNRITIDGLPFYSQLVAIKGGGFDFGFSVDASKLNGGVHVERAPIVQGHFLTKDHASKLMLALAQDKLAGYESRYF